jgi:hypothetical protein
MHRWTVKGDGEATADLEDYTRSPKKDNVKKSTQQVQKPKRIQESTEK